MKKRKKVVSTLLIASYLTNQSINVLAEELKDISTKNIEQTEDNLEVRPKSNSLNEVYLDGSKAISGSGTTIDDAVNNIKEALDLVAPYGGIYVTGEVVIPDDVHMPNKTIFIKQQDGRSKGKLNFEKKLYINNQLYVDDIEMEFSSNDKDCIFLNGNLLKINNVEIKGIPNIFIGSEDKDIDPEITGSLYITNDRLSNNPLGNINLGGKNGHTIEMAGLKINGVNVEGIINGNNVLGLSNVYMEKSLSVNEIENINRLYAIDDMELDVKGRLKNVTELYSEGTIKVQNGSKIDVGYIYGTSTLDIELPDNGTLIEGTYIKSKRIVGNIKLSDRLTKLGYSINMIKGENSVSFDVSSNLSTNNAPVIKNLTEITLKEGTSTDLKIGVEAWDEEDGDITKNIVFPDIDLKTLTVGRHEVTYEVTDSDNNKTTMNRIINVVSNEAPKINGIKDTTIKVGEVDNFDLLEGITITDDHDNNLKATVSGKIEKPFPGTNIKSIITYIVEDSDGNSTTETRVITVTNQLPVISGVDDIIIKKGQAVDLLSGVKALDEEDGDITNNIVIKGNVDINKEDEYKLIYEVTDSDGNTTQIERLVVVEKDDEVVPPIEELENSLPNSIIEAITNNLVNLNSGTGTVDNPLEIEFNNISDDKVDSLLSDLNNINTKINSLESKNGYTFVNLTILKESNSKTFKASDFRDLKEETHIVLKVKDEYENIADKLREFAKNNIEDSKDDNLNSDLDNNINNDNSNNGNVNNDNGNNDNINNDNINNDNVNNDSINSDNQKLTGENPKTGDYLGIGMLGSLASLSLSGLILNNFGRKKNKKNNN